MLKQYKIYFILLLALVSLSGSFYSGYHIRGISCEKDKAVEAQKALEMEKELRRKNDEIYSKYKEEVQRREREGKVITKKVIQYVEKNPDNPTCLNADGVQLWNEINKRAVQ